MSIGEIAILALQIVLIVLVIIALVGIRAGMRALREDRRRNLMYGSPANDRENKLRAEHPELWRWEPRS